MRAVHRFRGLHSKIKHFSQTWNKFGKPLPITQGFSQKKQISFVVIGPY